MYPRRIPESPVPDDGRQSAEVPGADQGQRGLQGNTQKQNTEDILLW